MSIIKVIAAFIEFYGRYNAVSLGKIKHLENPMRHLLTNGDCGVMALAVGWVYEQNGGKGLQYHDSGAHAFISVEGLYYDYDHQEGTTDITNVDTCDRLNPAVKTRLELQDGYLPVDNLGLSWINAFALEQGVSPYSHLPLSLTVLDKDQIKATLLYHGFKEKEQSNGVVDLNPYVYNAMVELLAEYELQRNKEGDK